MPSPQATRVLFVCLGNFCRSPAAEAIMRDLAPDLSVDSAGTSGWHVGTPPYEPMVAAAARRGIDLRTLRGRKVAHSDFDDFDLIIGMDEDNLRDLHILSPGSRTSQVRLLMDFAPAQQERAVPDPYYTRDFDAALDLIEAGCAGLLEWLDRADR